MKIHSRSNWGAHSWRGQPYSVPASARTHFLVHYHGGIPRNDRGAAMAKEVESIHLNNGWSGVGYNFMVGQDGGIYEGRGWGYVGAHCPGRNRDGIGVYVAIGGNQKPTQAALKSVRALYDEANRRAGHALIKSWHGANYPTSCPGPHLIAWVKAGMKTSGKLPTVPRPTLPARKPKPGRIAVDGLRGPATYRALQKAVRSPADGIWGPATRRALQRHLLVTVDGIVGRNTVKALQRKVGARADGIWGRNTTKALQRALNRGKF